ncbi:MAG: RDD family protein [Thermoleophilaceae bacterium]|nr:RDD family protein [Thermoleophilaceae bacterium]
MRTRVVRADGARLTQLTILIRETLPKYVLPLSAMAWSVPVGGALLVLWLVDSLAAVADRGGRSLHDRLAGTRSTGAAVVASAVGSPDRACRCSSACSCSSPTPRCSRSAEAGRTARPSASS